MAFALVAIVMSAGCGSDGGDGCAEPIRNPDQSLAGYTAFSPDQKMGNPSAGDPTNVYLRDGKDAVVLLGPPLPDGGAPLVLRNPSIALAHAAGSPPTGYAVVVNDHLTYSVEIDDFEMEVVLARVDVCRTGGNLESRFYFAAPALGNGVARMVTIRPVVDGVPAATTSAPVNIETGPF
jgi:hypothetical protein